MMNNDYEFPHPRYEEEQIIEQKKIEEEIYKKIISSSLENGIPNSILMGDYYMMIIVLKNCLVATKDTNLAAASAFFTVYFSLLLHSSNYALVDTLGILGSQAIGAKEQKKSCFILKQSILFGFLLFIFLTVIPSFFFEKFLIGVFDIEEDVAVLSEAMIKWTLPAMGIRILNDCLKTFIQNHKIERNLGITYMILLVIFIPISIYFVNFLNLGAKSVGVVLLIFEFLGLISCIVYLRPLYGTEYLDFSLSILETSNWNYLKTYVNYYLVDMPVNILYEFETFVISLTKSKEQMAVYTICSTFIFGFYYLGAGLAVEVRTMINRKIGERDIEGLKLYLKSFKSFYLIAALILAGVALGMVWIMELFAVYGEKGSEIREIMFYVKFILYLRFVTNIWANFIYTALKSAGVPQYIRYFYTYPYFTVVLSDYILGIYLNYGIYGVLSFGSVQGFYTPYNLYPFLEEEKYVEFVEIIFSNKS